MRNYQRKVRTAECVSPKHPDKICDVISDAFLDACLNEDKASRVAMETAGGHGCISLIGETTTKADVDVQGIIERVVGNRFYYDTNIVNQSKQIANGVDTGGAGDQGIMVGYACDESESKIPLEMEIARQLCMFIYEKYPVDGKTQITIRDRVVIIAVASFVGVKTVLLDALVRDFFATHPYIICGGLQILCNPAGYWDVGGLDADAGLTGRKIVVDAYGPGIPVGGGAFSGKDPTKVDRSGAYYARNLALKYLKEFDAKEVFVYLAYAIGIPYPVDATVTVFDSGGRQLSFDLIEEVLSVAEVIEKFDLVNVKYEKVAEWGSFGRDFPWEQV